MEYNKEVTSAALGLVYICVFWQFCKVLKGLSNSREKSNQSTEPQPGFLKGGAQLIGEESVGRFRPPAAVGGPEGKSPPEALRFQHFTNSIIKEKTDQNARKYQYIVTYCEAVNIRNRPLGQED